MMFYNTYYKIGRKSKKKFSLFSFLKLKKKENKSSEIEVEDSSKQPKEKKQKMSASKKFIIFIFILFAIFFALNQYQKIKTSRQENIPTVKNKQTNKIHIPSKPKTTTPVKDNPLKNMSQAIGAKKNVDKTQQEVAEKQIILNKYFSIKYGKNVQINFDKNKYYFRIGNISYQQGDTIGYYNRKPYTVASINIKCAQQIKNLYAEVNIEYNDKIVYKEKLFLKDYIKFKYNFDSVSISQDTRENRLILIGDTIAPKLKLKDILLDEKASKKTVLFACKNTVSQETVFYREE